MKKIDELKQLRESVKEEVRSLNADVTKVDEAEAKLAELRSIDKQIKNQEELDKSEIREVNEKMENRDMKPNLDENKTVEIRTAFANKIKGKNLSEEETRALSGLTEDKGKVTIPVDVQTKINEFKREMKSMKNYVRVEPVGTRSGTRVFEKLSDMTPLATREELSLIPEVKDPEFETISYNILNYAGLLRISNELLEDSAENLLNYISRHFAKKAITTENMAIFGLLNTAYSTKKAIAVGKEGADIKSILNVDIDPALVDSARIYTNQDGFQHLDTLVDTQGNFLLQADVQDSTKKRLFGKEVVVFSNKILPTVSKKVPFIIGDVSEAVTFFDRKQPQLDMTQIGSDAYDTNSTVVRMIERFDARVFDKGAVVYAQLTLPTVTA